MIGWSRRRAIDQRHAQRDGVVGERHSARRGPDSGLLGDVTGPCPLVSSRRHCGRQKCAIGVMVRPVSVSGIGSARTDQTHRGKVGRLAANPTPYTPTPLTLNTAGGKERRSSVAQTEDVFHS